MLLAFHPSLITYGERKVVIMVIAPIIGRMCGLVAPTHLARDKMLLRAAFLVLQERA
jgi:hypothetical protein